MASNGSTPTYKMTHADHYKGLFLNVKELEEQLISLEYDRGTTPLGKSYHFKDGSFIVIFE